MRRSNKILSAAFTIIALSSALPSVQALDESGQQAGTQTSPNEKQDEGSFREYGETTFSVNGKQLSSNEAKALTLFNQSVTPMQNSQWEQALGFLQQALAANPDMLVGLINAGLCCNQLGRYDEGIAYLEKAVQIDPNSLEARLNLASGCQSSGRIAEAIDNYNEFLTKFPQDSHVAQVSALVQQLQLEQARQSTVKGKHGNKGQKAEQPNSDNDYFAYIQPDSIMKWAKDRFPLKVYVPSDEEALSTPGYTAKMGSMLKDAFKQWADNSKGTITYQFVSQPRGADIECKWAGDSSQVRTPAEGGDAKIVTDVGKGIGHVNITLLTKVPATNDPTITVDTIGTTALHEVGHSLGITAHSPNSGDIMFFSVPLASGPRHLSQRDINTLLHLYKTNIKAGGKIQSSTGDPKMDLNNEATNLMLKNDYVGAAEKLEEVLKVDPNFQTAKINLGICLTNSANQLAKHRKFDEAATQYKRAVELLQADADQTRRATVMKNYASMLYNMGKDEEAREIETAANKLVTEGRK